MASKPGRTLLGLLATIVAAGVMCSGRERSNPSLGAASPVDTQDGLPVFPGAEGFGTRTRAGRGGRVTAVTSLADSGPGTLRAALQDPSPKTIVFRIGGIIELKSLLFVAHPFVTIAGQTAPGDGIVLKDFGIVVMTNDVLIQSIRVRPGNTGATKRPDNNKAIAILGPNGDAKGAYNVVVDHVSASWGEDETITTWFGAHDVTVSWSIASEALDSNRHPKGPHSSGVLIGQASDRVSIHHSLLAHNRFRNPLFTAGGTHEFVNNVVYDWGQLVTEIVDNASTSVNVIGNWYRPGPSSKTPYEIFINPSGRHLVPQVYVTGNAKFGETIAPADDWARVQFGWNGNGAPAKFRAAAPARAAVMSVSPAAEAMALVLDGAGASAPRRDAVDRRVVADVRNGTGSVISSPDQVGGYPVFDRGVVPVDSDGDGIPDEWERRNGLNPANPSDGSADRGDGYTNLETYLHALMSRPNQQSGKH